MNLVHYYKVQKTVIYTKCVCSILLFIVVDALLVQHNVSLSLVKPFTAETSPSQP